MNIELGNFDLGMLERGDMDHLFKKNLQKIKNKSTLPRFQDRLFDVDFNFIDPSQLDCKVVDPSQKQIEIIHSLEKFAKNHLLVKEKTYQLPGGEISLKSEISKIQHYELKLPTNFQERFLAKKVKNKIKVIFVSELLEKNDDLSDEILSDDFLNQLIWCFPKSTAELFKKMIIAMKLSSEEFILYPFEHNKNSLKEDIFHLCENYTAKIVISLGAKATQMMLERNDRLTQVHGEFFHLKTNSHYNFQLVPLFHPSIIETSQNMKKTAWVDMQKIMKALENLA